METTNEAMELLEDDIVLKGIGINNKRGYA